MIIHQREISYKKNYAEFFETLVQMKALLEKKFPDISVELMYNLAGQRGRVMMQIRYPSLADYERIDAEADKDEEYKKLIDSLLSASGQLPMFMEFMVQASRDESIWAATIAPYRRYQKQFAALIAEGQAEGSIREDLDPDTTAQLFISLGVGVLLQSVVAPDLADWEMVITRGIESILENIRRIEK